MDDDAPSRQLLKALLRHTKHTLREACDGLEALAIAMAAKPDVVLSDIVMPKLDGYQLAYELTTNHEVPPLSIILYSATYLPSEAKGLASACGIHYFLTKPTDPVVLLYTVDEVLKLGPRTRTVAGTREEFLDLHSRLISHKLTTTMDQLIREVAERKLADVENSKLISELNAYRANNSTATDAEVLPRPLSVREREVLLHLATGLNNREIAATLFVAEGTIKTHVKHILEKLGVEDRFKAASWAVHNGLTLRKVS